MLGRRFEKAQQKFVAPLVAFLVAHGREDSTAVSKTTKYADAWGISFNDEAIKEVERLDDRGAAIIMGALIEQHLLKTRFTNDDKEIDGQIFKGYGPLASFKSRIDIGFKLGLYNLYAHRNLVRVKEIRNRFAHSHKALNFNHQDISDLCDSLPTKQKLKECWICFISTLKRVGLDDIGDHIQDKILPKIEEACVKTHREKFSLYIELRKISLLMSGFDTPGLVAAYSEHL